MSKAVIRSILSAIAVVPLLVLTLAAPAHADPIAGSALPVNATANDEVIVPEAIINAARDRIIGSVESSKTENAATIERVYISVAAVTTSTGDDINVIDQAAAQALVTKMNTYWNSESNGDVTIQFGGFETRSLGSSTCVPNTVFNQVTTVAFAGAFNNGNWVDSNNHLLIMSKEDCGGQAFGTVGNGGGLIFSGAGVGDALGVPISYHEFGHNLGFRHADSTICASTTNYDAPQASLTLTSTTCPTEEYGDILDIMGYTIDSTAPHLSSVQKIRMGWMTSYTSLSTNNTSTTTQLTALGTASGTQAIRVTDPGTGDVYYIEYRAPVGRDSNALAFGTSNLCFTTSTVYIMCEGNTNPATGSVRILRSIATEGTTVLAVTPTSGQPATTRNTHLNIGGVFTSHSSSIKVTVNSMSPSTGASVTVLIGTAAPAVPKNTTTTLASSASTSSYGSKQVVLTGTVAAVSGVYPAGSFKFYDGTTSLGSVAASANGTGSYSLPFLFAVGQHNVSVKFIPTSLVSYNISQSALQAVIITKAPSTTKTTLTPVTVSQNARYATSATISAKSVTSFTGSLGVYIDGVLAITYPISTSSTTTNFVLPKLPVGTHSVYIKYSGSTLVSSTQSTVVTITSV